MTPTMSVAVYDSSYTPLGQVATYNSCTVSWVHLDVGTGELVVDEGSSFAPLLLTVDQAPVLVKAIVNGVNWVGRVVGATLDRAGPPGTGTWTADLVSEFVWLQYMQASQNGSNPAVTSMPEFDTQTGPAATVAAYYINAAAARLGVPVIAIAPDDDTSGTVTLQARYGTSLADLLLPTLAAQGVVVDVDVITDRAKIPAGQPSPARLPVVAFTLRQSNSGPPALRWSDTAAHLSALKLELTGATGYRATVGLAGDGAARVYDVATDDPPGGTGGPYALPEISVDDTNDTAAGAGSQAAGLNELISRRGRMAASFTVDDGNPWTFGTDYTHGDIGTIYVSGVRFDDRITKVTAANDATNGLVVSPLLGDLTVSESTAVLLSRALANVQTQVRLLQAH